MQLQINERQIGNIVILDLIGKITIGEGSNLLRDAVNNLLESGQCEIILNFAEAGYIDSSGIGELVSGYTTITNNGGALKLLNLGKRVQDLLQITKLYTVFETFDDEAAAIRSFS